ncbi:MAG: pentapeptide repeat-containing protein [Anaerolineae bacterium]|nr:pentapeptide repeat-containing protein [Anaerolineae bacterium]
MSDNKLLNILAKGAKFWNTWRRNNPSEERLTLNFVPLHKFDLDLTEIDLSACDLIGSSLIGVKLYDADLSEANLQRANLTGADLQAADMRNADLSGAILDRANLSHANLHEANLSTAKLTFANLRGATLHRADLTAADLRNADLTRAHLEHAKLFHTNLTKANLSEAYVFGLSVWKSPLPKALQFDLTITPVSEPEIMVDGIETAVFISFLIASANLSDIFEINGKNLVLILRQYPWQVIRPSKSNALRESLRKQKYNPVCFDYAKSPHLDINAGKNALRMFVPLARFIIVDLMYSDDIMNYLMSAWGSKPPATMLWKPSKEGSAKVRFCS